MGQFAGVTLTGDELVMASACAQYIHLVPLIDGTWAFETGCPVCEFQTGGLARDWRTALRQISHHTDRVEVTIPSRGARRNRIGRRQGALCPPVGAVPDYQVELDREPDPFMVTSDGAVTRGRVLRWAVVTGAGWVRTGTVIPDSRSGSTQAELFGIIEALRLYPVGSTVRVLCDAKRVVDLLKHFLGRARSKPNGQQRRYRAAGGGGLHHALWVSDELRNQLGHVTGERHVHALWVPRDTHRLQRVADAFASQRELPGIVFRVQDMGSRTWSELTQHLR